MLSAPIDAVIAHDAGSVLAGIKVRTQIAFGRHDAVTFARSADAMKNGIARSEMTVFEAVPMLHRREHRVQRKDAEFSQAQRCIAAARPFAIAGDSQR